jgi:hypothetical protein
MKPSPRQAAQNQHYVPKFILRNFLGEPGKEQVHVFSKSKSKGFTTSIKNIFAERRFHEFRIDENYMASFEESICRVEDKLLPTYRTILEQRRLDGSPEQRVLLGMLMAFQFLRTRAQRDQFVHVEQQLAGHLKRMGSSLEDVDGYEPFTEDTLKIQHIRFIRKAMEEFTNTIAVKDFVLIEAHSGRSFYLSDNPVNINNSQPQVGPFGNMGLACKGIEVYMPLSADLVLCAWCPSILERMRKEHIESERKLATFMLSSAMTNVSNAALVARNLEQFRQHRAKIDETLRRVKDGIPLAASSENMDYQNGLQVSQASEHVICKTANFDLAKRFMKDFPDSRG